MFLNIQTLSKNLQKFSATYSFSSTNLVQTVNNNHVFQFVFKTIKLHVILVLLFATAQVERLFTCIKKILGDWHLSLNLELVDALLRIAVDGPDTDSFNPSRAVQHWYSTIHRNPDNSFL